MDNELVLVLDFGGQYNQLIARRVRSCNVYCEVRPYTLSASDVKKLNPKGIIFTGGPSGVFDENAPKCSEEIFNMGIPILGICYGMQLMGHILGGEVAPSDIREYGKTDLKINGASKIFDGLDTETVCWMSHTY